MNKFSWLYVFIGGGMGSVLRYGIGLLLDKKSFMPLGTFVSNMLASLVLGLLAGYIAKQSLHPHLVALLAVGFCGGFSTFSTFSKDNFELLQNNQYSYFFINILLSVVLGIACFAIGYIISIKN